MKLLVRQRPSLQLFAPADRRWPGPERNASESDGQGAESAARAARRPALTTVTETIYRKQLRPVVEGGAEVMDLTFPAWLPAES